MMKLKHIGILGLLGCGAVSACAPSTLYGGSVRGNWTVGEIPRDARGEPVWAAIPPVPGTRYASRGAAGGVAGPVAEIQEGDSEDFPTQPRE